MLPIGAYAPRWFMRHQHMNWKTPSPRFRRSGRPSPVAMHWGTFKLTDEPLQEPPEFLRRVWEGAGLPDARRRIPAIGETLVLR